MKRFAWLTVLVFAASLLLAGVAAAQEPVPTPSDDDVNAVAKQLYCPVCENIPLDVCPTQACAQWRDLIRLKLGEGWSEADIKDYFVDQYGARVLAEPPRSGLNWLVYVVPPALFALGVFILYRTLTRWRQNTVAVQQTVEPAAPVTHENEYLDRVEEELRKRK